MLLFDKTAFYSFSADPVSTHPYRPLAKAQLPTNQEGAVVSTLNLLYSYICLHCTRTMRGSFIYSTIGQITMAALMSFYGTVL